MKYEATAEFSEAFVKTVTRRFTIKFLGWRIFVWWLLILVISSVRGDWDWLVSTLLTLLGVTIVVAVMVFIILRRRAIAAYHDMHSPTVRFVFDDENIAVTSDLSSGTIKWRAFKKLWRFPEAWLLFASKRTYMTVPTNCLTDEAKEFIITKLKEQGVKVS